ncbi:hypothetical protein U9M48_003336 [Paspalum notatum var. saurae]|uniref:Uncharacterized protein n=1 Tax=Paspalum notatum var. saurae TaxID=547442 RepID=A0AAQ3SJU2_PASNO
MRSRGRSSPLKGTSSQTPSASSVAPHTPVQPRRSPPSRAPLPWSRGRKKEKIRDQKQVRGTASNNGVQKIN